MKFTGSTFLEFRHAIRADVLDVFLTRYQTWVLRKSLAGVALPPGRAPGGRYSYIDWLYDVAYRKVCKQNGLEMGPFDVDLSPITADDLLDEEDEV